MMTTVLINIWAVCTNSIPSRPWPLFCTFFLYDDSEGLQHIFFTFSMQMCQEKSSEDDRATYILSQKSKYVLNIAVKKVFWQKWQNEFKKFSAISSNDCVLAVIFSKPYMFANHSRSNIHWIDWVKIFFLVFMNSCVCVNILSHPWPAGICMEDKELRHCSLWQTVILDD